MKESPAYRAKLKNYRGVTILFLLIALAVVIRTAGIYGFRYDARTMALPSVNGSNIITNDQVRAMKEDVLIIELESDLSGVEKITGIPVLRIHPESILENGTIKRIRKNKGPVILTSSDISLTARVWMILSQKGLKNILILSADKGVESLTKKSGPTEKPDLNI